MVTTMNGKRVKSVTRGRKSKQQTSNIKFPQTIAKSLSEPEIDYSNEPKKTFMSKEDFFEFFERTTDSMLEISRMKNNDYTGVGTSPFANFTRVESMGACSTEQGFLTRMCDKLSRISSFCAKGELLVKDESVTDSLKDLSNYCILFMGYLEEKRLYGSKV